MFGLDEWIAVGAIALPLIGKALTDFQTNTVLRHNAALDRVVGMAGREAATIGRVLAQQPPGADAGTFERQMVARAAAVIFDEMEGSAKVIGGDPAKIRNIVQGELDKVVTPVPAAEAPRAQDVQLAPSTVTEAFAAKPPTPRPTMPARF